MDKEALKAGVTEGIIEAVELVPGLGVLIKGVRAYHQYIEEKQKEDFLKLLVERLEVLEDAFSDEWYRSDEGITVTKKIIVTALNAEFADKTEYFVNALFNASFSDDQLERLKFIEMLRSLSKPALVILAAESYLQNKRGPHYSEQVLVAELVKETGFSPYLVESCVKELYSIGVFSSVTDYQKNGATSRSFEEGTAAFTKFTKKFIEFIRDPRE